MKHCSRLFLILCIFCCLGATKYESVMTQKKVGGTELQVIAGATVNVYSPGATASADGLGTTVTVYDSSNIQVSDVVDVEGQTATVQTVPTSTTFTVDSSLTWSKGDRFLRTNATVTIYEDEGGTTTITQPHTTTANGTLIFYYDAPPFDIVATATGGLRQVIADATSGTVLTDDAKFKGLPWHDVTHPTYGAKGDGTTDDATAFQAAIDASETDGGVVYVPYPSDKYIIKSTLTLPNITGFGDPGFKFLCDYSAQIRMDSSGDTLFETTTPATAANRWWFEGCFIDTTNAEMAFDLDTVKNSHFQDLHISGFTGTNGSIALDGATASYTTFDNIDIVGGVKGLVITGASTNENVIKWCTFRNQTGVGLEIASNANRTLIIGNAFEQQSDDAIRIQGAGSPGAQGTTIAFNRFENVTGLDLSIDETTPDVSSNMKCFGNESVGGAFNNSISARELVGACSNNTWQAEKLIVSERSNPTLEWIDRDTTDEDVSASIDVTCTSTATNAEDCDVSIKAQSVSGAAAEFLKFDADVGDAGGAQQVEIVDAQLMLEDCATAAAAATISADSCNVITVGGTNQVDTINTCDANTKGRILVILCGGTATPYGDGTGNMQLAGAFTCTDDDTLTLMCEGSTGDWLEVSRSVN